MRSASRSASRAFGLALALLVGPAARAQVRTEAEDHAARREEYLMAPRAYPLRSVTPGALLRARLDVEARFGLLARANMAASQMGLASAWTSLGPTTIDGGFAAGRVTAIAVHPIQNNIVFAGGAQGGVWKSIDGGDSWAPLTENQCSLAVGSITIDPVNPNIMYVGTGEQNRSGDSYYGCGVLRSSDGGASWTQLGADVFVTTTGGARIGHVIIDASTAGSATSTTVMVSTTFGLFRSMDSGRSWSRVLTTGNVSGLAVDPVNSQVWYAGVAAYDSTAQSNGVFKSTDGGVTWKPLPLTFGTTVGRIELAIAPSNGSVLYAAAEDRTPNSSSAQQLAGIWRSSDAGVTWTKTGARNASCASQCWYDLSIAVDPSNPARVYMGGFSFYRSEDSAETFTNVGTTIHVDHHTIAFDPLDPNAIYVGTDGGVYRTPNRGLNWVNRNNSLAIAQFYNGISLHPTDTLTVIGGTQDNGTLQYSGFPSWSSIIGGDGGYTAINPKKPTFMFGELEWLTGSSAGGNGPRRADAPGAVFRVKNTGINTADRAQFIPPYVIDPMNPFTLYFGTYRVYRTTDNAESWATMSPDLSKTGTGTITTIGVSPTDATVLYAGLNDGNVAVTRDSGATWSTIATGLPNRAITQIVVDEVDPKTAYLTNSGFGAPHVWRTTDGGATWTNISGDLPNVPVNAIALLPRTKDLYVGTDLGVFRSTNGGAAWVPFMEGFPNVAVFALAFNDRTRKLVAATHGRGMFQYSMPALVLRGDVDGDGKITAADAQLILMATIGLPLPRGMFAYPSGDVNCDGLTNALDAQIILSYLVGQNTSQFCINTIR
jgi:photosystem II stability/assembly factor-like uncharacterized protein